LNQYQILYIVNFIDTDQEMATRCGSRAGISLIAVGTMDEYNNYTPPVAIPKSIN
jgi:hypothetical protein